MTVLLSFAFLILLLTGHWVWAFIVLLILGCLSNAGDDGAKPKPTPSQSAPPMRVAENPRAHESVDYGMNDAQYTIFLTSQAVTGRPASGLGTAVAAGMSDHNVRAGVAGEESLARMFTAMDQTGRLDGARVYFSCRNPGDTTGNTDIDCIVATGDTVWLLDAKHYTPAAPNACLVPTPGLGAGRRAGKLRAYDGNANLNVPVASLNHVAPVKTYHASGNMAWAADAVRHALPSVRVRPAVLLTRTSGGVYGVMAGTEFPGHVPVMTADGWAGAFTSQGAPAPAVDRYLRSLVKDRSFRDA